MFHINHELGKSIHRDRMAADKHRICKQLRAERAAQALMNMASEIQRSPQYVPSIRERLWFLRLGAIGR